METKDKTPYDYLKTSINDTTLTDAYRRGKQAGIREVIGVVEPILLDETIGIGRKLIKITDEIAELKDSGIE